jgi:murein DD-endopeptidase MepM/ murein hydrolase activator NlpD
MNVMSIFLRHLLKFLILIPILLICTVQFASAENDFRLKSLSRVVNQGDVCLISLSGPTSPKSAFAEFRGVRSPLAFNEQDGTYEGLIGIDMGTRPATYEIKIVTTDGESDIRLSNLLLKVEKVDFGIQKLSLPSSMVDLDRKSLERVNKEQKKLNSLFRAFRNERLWRGAFICPLEGELSAVFGLSRIINGQRRGPHTGVDLRAEEGTPVLACNSGIVVLVDQLFFSGRSILLDHGWGLYSMYFHLSEALVEQGKAVGKGAMLGRVGSTGRSTGPHLHWGIRINGARVDPFSLLSLKVITISENKRQE